jgi:hypothetical protein
MHFQLLNTKPFSYSLFTKHPEVQDAVSFFSEIHIFIGFYIKKNNFLFLNFKWRQFFIVAKKINNKYGAPDPDAIGRSQRFIMLAMNELQYFLTLPKNLDDERNWRQALSQFKVSIYFF